MPFQTRKLCHPQCEMHWNPKSTYFPNFCKRTYQAFASWREAVFAALSVVPKFGRAHPHSHTYTHTHIGIQYNGAHKGVSSDMSLLALHI